MTYADVRYISVARINEMRHHKRTMEQLEAKIAQLTKAVAWELDQHHARLKELQQAEDTLDTSKSQAQSFSSQPTLEPIPSSQRRWTKSRKYVHRSAQNPAAQLVG